MAQYKISEDSGAFEIREADSLEQALEQAREWSAGGSYDERVMVRCWAILLDEDGEETDERASAEVEAGPEPKAPECNDDEEHDWQSPHSVVGGLGVSAGTQAASDERIPHLLQTPAAVRFLSAEPLLESINLRLIGLRTLRDLSSYEKRRSAARPERARRRDPLRACRPVLARLDRAQS